MGTPANVVVKNDVNDPGVFLYQHFDGPNVAYSVQATLSKVVQEQSVGKVYDTPKIASMIFRQMLADSEQEFGISTDYAAFSSYFGIEVRVEEQEVEIDGEVWSFTDFTNLDLKSFSEH